jgi:hypothetical protein
VEREQREPESSSVSEREPVGLDPVVVVARGRALVTEQSLVNDIPPAYNFVRMPRALALIVLASLLLPGCHRHPRIDDGYSEMSLDDAQQTLTLTAISRLQNEFNHGACQSIYDEAGAGFRSQTSEEWLRECALLQNELGSWKSFQAKDTFGFGTRELIVLVVGLAEFEKENQQVEINWILTDKTSGFHSIRFRKSEGQDWMEFPRVRPSRKWQDPPIKLPQNGITS